MLPTEWLVVVKPLQAMGIYKLLDELSEKWNGRDLVVPRICAALAANANTVSPAAATLSGFSTTDVLKHLSITQIISHS